MARVDDEQRRGEHEIERGQRHVAHGARAACGVARRRGFDSSSRACARRSTWRAIVADEHDAAPRQHVKLDELLDERRGLRRRARRSARRAAARVGSSMQRAHERQTLALAGRQQRRRAGRAALRSSSERLHEPVDARRAGVGGSSRAACPSTRPARPRNSARAGATRGPASRCAPRRRETPAPAPDRDRRWRAAAASCRRPRRPRWRGTRRRPPRSSEAAARRPAIVRRAARVAALVLEVGDEPYSNRAGG